MGDDVLTRIDPCLANDSMLLRLQEAARRNDR